MGNKQTAEEKADVEGTLTKWRKKYKVPDAAWEALRSNFNKMAGPSKDKASLDAVQKWFSNALGAQTAKQLARAIDTDKSGYVDVLEYMQFWCVQIGGTNSEKITTFFNLLDADGNGKLAKDEMTDFLILGNKLAAEAAGTPVDPSVPQLMRDVVEKVFKDIDVDNDGSLTLDEVLKACTKYPDYESFFTQFASGVAGKFSKEDKRLA